MDSFHRSGIGAGAVRVFSAFSRVGRGKVPPSNGTNRPAAAHDNCDPLPVHDETAVVAGAAIVGSVFFLMLEKNVRYFVAMPAATIVIAGLLVGIMAVRKKL